MGVFIWVHFVKVFVSLREAVGRAEALREGSSIGRAREALTHKSQENKTENIRG